MFCVCAFCSAISREGGVSQSTYVSSEVCEYFTFVYVPPHVHFVVFIVYLKSFRKCNVIRFIYLLLVFTSNAASIAVTLKEVCLLYV